MTRQSKAPSDPRAALGLAQISFEAWRPAAGLFAKARALMPGNADALRNHALALTAEGQSDVAEATAGGERCCKLPVGSTATAFWRRSGTPMVRKTALIALTPIAVRRDPDNVALRMAWFQQHATVKNWTRAGAILADARKALPDHLGLELADLFLASEADEARRDTDAV